jgi:putative tryptophan/tyrosine transport system substrate-binding protein
MRRREVVAGLAGSVTWPLVAQAQPPPTVRRIAIVHASNPIAQMNEGADHPYYPAFFAELRRLGYVEGHNLTVERRSGEGRVERYPELAREVVGLRPDLIFTSGTQLPSRFKAATSTIPIVALTGDPVALGLADSLARPGGNVTGVSSDTGVEVLQKYIELLKEAVPNASQIAWLQPRASWTGVYKEAPQEAAQRVGVKLVAALLEGVIQDEEYRRAFAIMAQERVNALAVAPGPENLVHRRLTVELAAEARLPAMYPFREHAEVGGLMAYAPDIADLARQAAGSIARILNGQKPGEIPFYQPTKFNLILNLKTAKVLGLAVPSSLLARADEVIE